MEIIKKISSYLLIGILVLSAILLTVASLIKWNLKENRIMNYMKENDLSFILKTKDGYTTDLLEDTKTYLEKIGIPKEAIEEVINSNPTKEFVGKYTYKILNYIIYKKGSVQITKEDILDLVKNNFPVVETALKEQNQPFLPEYQKNILLLIDKYIDHIMDLFPTVNHLITKIEQEEFYQNKEFKIMNYVIKLSTTKTVILTLIAMMVLSGLLLLLIHWRKQVSLIYLRTALLIYAFFFIGIEIIMGTIVKSFFMTEWKSANSILNYLINIICKNLWIFILCGLGCAILITLILKKWNERKREQQVLEQVKV